MALLIIGIVLMVVSGIMIAIRASQQKKLGSLARAEVTTVAQLQQLAGAVGGELSQLGTTGAGYSQLVALSGRVQADEPLHSELAGERCVYYDYTVEREYEETYEETNSETKEKVTKTRRQSETVSHNTRRVPFRVDDGTGAIAVEPEGADIDSVQTLERFEQATGHGAGMFQIGSVSISWDPTPIGGRRTLGYKYRERALAVGANVFVLGQATDANGKLTVAKPPDGRSFIVSLKTREQLIGSARSAVQWLLYGAIGMDVLGLVLILLYAFRR